MGRLKIGISAQKQKEVLRVPPHIVLIPQWNTEIMNLLCETVIELGLVNKSAIKNFLFFNDLRALFL